MSGYCDAAPGHPLHGPYHDDEYGFPLTDEAALFERLSLEIFQAGLSWLLVLRKRDGMRAAFANFDVDAVAAYGEADVARLLADPGIIRNRLKIAAIIENARRIQALRDTDGGFAAWIAARHPRSREVVNEFLMSIGYLPGAHREDCPAFVRIAALNPPWRDVLQDGPGTK